MKILLLFLALGLVFSDPQVYFLNKFNNENTPTNLPVESGGNLYLASNDATSQLQKIKITNGGNTFQLDQLQNGNGIRILSNQLTIQVDIEPSVTATLSGFLYATSAQQAKDHKFYVTVVNGAQTLSRTDVENSTTVVLNTELKNNAAFDAPSKTTAVSEIQQFGATELNFHHDIPRANYTTEVENNFFENPLYYSSYYKNLTPSVTRVFYDSVEPMQVNLPYWYITANGPYNMKLSSTFDGSQTHNTTSANATGVFVMTDVWLPRHVNFITDNTRGGVSGCLLTLDLNYTAQVVFQGYESTFPMSFSAGEKLDHAQIGTGMVAKSLVINGTTIYPGTLFCQYFVFTGDLLPTTSSISTTTVQLTTPTTFSTTTDSASGHGFLLVVFFPFLKLSL